MTKEMEIQTREHYQTYTKADLIETIIELQKTIEEAYENNK
jgi:hypothetical protein